MHDQSSFSFKTYYSLFLRNKGLFLAPLIAIFSLVSLSGFFFPEIYESSTLIRVQKKQPNPIGTGRLVREDDMRTHLTTIREMALSRPNLLKSVRSLGLDKDIENNAALEDLIESVRSSITIKSKGKEFFQVFYQDKDPERSMQMTNTVVKLFIEEHLSLKRKEAFSSVDFIQEQLDMYKEKLEQSEETLRKFKEAHIGEMPGEQNVNLIQLERLRDELARTSMSIQEAYGKKKLIEKQLSGEQPMIVSMRIGEASSVEEKIKILEFQLSQLLANYTEKHPDIVRIQTEIASLKKEGGSEDLPEGERLLQSGEMSTLNPLYQKLKEDHNRIIISIGTLHTKKGLLGKKILAYEKKVISIPSQEKELAALQRDYNVNERIYDMLHYKLEEAKMTKQLEFTQGGTRYQVIEPAYVPIKPIKPNRLHFLVGGLAFGCAAGSGLIFLKEYFNTSTRGVHEAERVYNLAVLTEIPVINTEREVQIRHQARKRWILGTALFTLLVIGLALFAFTRGA